MNVQGLNGNNKKWQELMMYGKQELVEPTYRQ